MDKYDWLGVELVSILIAIFFFLLITASAVFNLHLFFNRKKLIKKANTVFKGILPLTWTITSTEGTGRMRLSVKIAFLFFVPVFFIASITQSKSMDDFMLALPTLGFILVIFFLAYIRTYIIKPKERKYIFTENGIRIAKGQKEGEYRWEDFEYFYIHPDDAGDSRYTKREQYISKRQRACGIRFYLRLNSKNIFYKIIPQIVTIYSEPNNYNEIHELLKNKLPNGYPIFLRVASYKFN